MKNLLFLLCLSPVFGFLPQPFINNEPGITKPLGFFDPLGLSNNKTPIQFKKLQEAELKHGRVAMLASLGLLVQNVFHPILGNDVEIGKSIYHFQIASSQLPWLLPGILSLVGITEIESIKKGWDSISSRYEIAQLREDYIPGDLGLDPLNIVDQEYQFKDMRSKELNNGRLAMIASIIIIIQQLI
jgi:hypothetical protein